MNEIQEDYHRRIEDRMKKIYYSTDIIKKIEEKRIIDIEEKKLEKFEINYENKHKYKDQLNLKRSKEKKRFEDAKYNYTELQKEREKKNIELSNKLKKKYYSNMKISGNLKDELSIKRQTSIERFLQNSSEIKKNNANRNLKLLKLQQEKNERSFDKIRTLDMSKENVR